MSCVTVGLGAQGGTNDALGSKGFHTNRSYFSAEPWEHVDAMSGNVILTFTDLSLPGNAGRALTFQRVYNSQRANYPGLPQVSRWTFGLAGIVMRVKDDWNPADPKTQAELDGGNGLSTHIAFFTPQFVTADGGLRRTIYRKTPFGDNAESQRWVTSGQFYVYDRTERKIYMPDGSISVYNAAGHLIGIWDQYGNTTSLQYFDANDQEVNEPVPNGMRQITQDLGNSQSRTVTIELGSDALPSRMVFDNREWLYTWQNTPNNLRDLAVVEPPEELDWTFTYNSAGDLDKATLPTGGRVEYLYEDEDVPIPDSNPLAFETIRTLHARTTYDRGGSTPLGVWTIELEWGAGDTFAGGANITTPSGTRVSYVHYGTGAEGRTLEGGVGLRERYIRNAGGTQLEREDLTYTNVTVAQTDGVPVYTQEVELRKTTRAEANGSRVYETEHSFDPAQFANYHRPTLVEERVGGVLVRRTEREYTHQDSLDIGGTLFVVGLPTEETVTIGGSALVRGWSYAGGSGFKLSETSFRTPGATGITTSFTADGRGNVATVTKANGKSTTFAYSYGQVSATITPAHTTSRSINLDGTVASETRNGRTTTYQYDDLGRVTLTQPPGPVNPIQTTYDNVNGASVTTSRGNSVVTTSLDGFGRPVGTINGAGVRTVTRYDDDGRKEFESLPFEGAGTGPGTRITYDTLDRVVRESNVDVSDAEVSYRQRTYGVDTIAVRDEEGRETVYSRQAFGHPDDARLTGVHDAAGSDWAYGYTVTGALASVSGPDGVSRSWAYNAQQLVETETHPESGAVSYQYDAAGVLKQKTDANGTTFTYAHDANDRVTSITTGGKVTTFTYEAGSDNRRSAQVGQQLSEFNYDNAGRLDWRRDTLDGISFTTRYEFDSNDNVEYVVYPSGRTVRNFFDNENRLTKVERPHTGAAYATDFAYHPSGAITAYRAGNNVVTTLGYHPSRYWLASINVPGLSMAYQYDDVGNVAAIGDSRQGWGNQGFTYDVLDRLATATGPYGAISYTYDAHGNRQDGSTYDPANRFRLTAMTGGLTFAYDNNGNMTGTAQSQVYNYTPDNLLDFTTADGSTTRFTYDADEWRLKKATDNGPATYYVRGPNGQLLTEWTTSPLTTRDYIYAGSRLIAVAESETPLPGTGGEGSGAAYHQVTLATWAGRYVAAEQDGTHSLFGNRSVALGWEQFTLVDVDGGDILDNDIVHLRADQWQLYVKAVGGGGGAVEASAETPAAWEALRIHRVGGSGPIDLGSEVAFSTENGHYLRVEYPTPTTPASIITATATSAILEATFTLGNGGAIASALAPGQQLQPDGVLESPTGRYRLVYQASDGNLVLYDTQGSQWVDLWDSTTNGFGAGTVTMEATGNLVVRDPSGTIRCDTQQQGWENAGLYLHLADDGVLRIHTIDGTTNRFSPGVPYPVCTVP